MKKQFKISVNGKIFEVIAEMVDDGEVSSASGSSRPAPASRAAARASGASAAPASKPLAAAAAGDLPSPLAGKVVSLDVAPGAEVKAGDQVITLEAMKMNTVVSSPMDGTIKAIHVAPGESVEEGQPLLTIA